MHYRTLGCSGAVVSEFALGTMTFGAEADEEASHAILDDYFAAGGTFIDTADVYTRGASEQIVGRWLAADSERAAQMVIATKGRFPMGGGPNDLGTSRRHLRTALEASLRRLGVEHIDLYQMHAWDPYTPIEETLRFLDDSVSAGLIGYYGFSNYLGWQLTKAVYEAKAHGWTAPVTLQPQYNLLVRGIESEIVPAALDAGMGLLPWGPLAGGWLSGKYRRDVAPTGHTRLGEDPQRGMEAWEPRNARSRTWEVIDTVGSVADAHGVSHAQVALRWIADRPAVTSVILGARTREQLADNLKASELVLAAEEVEELARVSEPEVEAYPYGPKAVAQRSRSIEGGR